MDSDVIVECINITTFVAKPLPKNHKHSLSNAIPQTLLVIYF